MFAVIAFPRRRKLGDRARVARPARRARLARALAIAQRHDLPELLARILAGRNVEVDAVEAFLDPTIKRLDARSERAHRHAGGRERASPTPSTRGEMSPFSAITTSTARPRRRCWRAFCAMPASNR
jgi:hypothetical protein